MAGEATAAPEERGIAFDPLTPWTPGSYRVVVHPEIEDLAGNSPARLFDYESGGIGPEKWEAIVILFEIRESSFGFGPDP